MKSFLVLIKRYQLASMLVLKRGNRLSITPVTSDEWRAVLKLLG